MKKKQYMRILKKMRTLSEETKTLNGAVAYQTSGNACLDLFAVGGSMRYRKDNEILRLFDRAYIETPDLAMKLLFHIRDIRGGMGERRAFRRILRHLAFLWPASAEKNVRFISEYGRWDDLLVLMGTPAQEEAVRVIRAQLEQDIAAARALEEGGTDVRISLLAKWLPSDNASSAAARGRARVLAAELGYTKREYRKTLVMIRRYMGLVERRLTEKRADRIRYEAVPARSMLKYRAAFERNDAERFAAFLEAVEGGRKRMHAGTLDPSDILQPFFAKHFICRPQAKGKRTLEALWRSQEGQIGSSNALCVVDTSGSMYWRRKEGPLPALFSQALGLYFAERCKGPFHNHVVTFESKPHLIELKGETSEDRLRYLQTTPWGGSTNLSAVFELVLTAAREVQAQQEEMPSVLYILSDMEFDIAFRRPDQTVFEAARERYAAFGYELPAVVFHNVNAWQTQTPVRAGTKGAALASGSGTSAMGAKYTKNTTPLGHMLEVLGSERYRRIHA